jgi:DNA-binding CsgD family transcriptional regulator
MRASAIRLDQTVSLVDDALDFVGDVAACGIDRSHRIVYWNDFAEGLLGWSSREAVGRSCYDIFKGHDIFGNVCCFRDCGVAVASTQGEAAAPFVMDVQHHDGTRLRLVTRTVALPSPGAAYRSIIHLFDRGDGAALDAVVRRIGAVVAAKPEPLAGPPEPSLNLTPREQEVLQFLASGYSALNIAARLNLSHATVRNHIQNLLRRMEVHSQVDAISVAFRRGLLGRDRDIGDGVPDPG